MKKYIISGKNYNEDIVLSLLSDKSEKEIENYIFRKIIMCLIVLSKNYNDSSSEYFNDSFEFFEENNIFLNKNSVDHIRDSFLKRADLRDQILEIHELSKDILFNIGWRDEIIGSSKSWSLIIDKSKKVLSKLEVSKNVTIYEYENLLDDDIIS
ncbi:hypothetical protein LVK10_05750 [Tenacibaculum maritimum]|uniref:hypothetical protein n=2 Tax=Tenacibaculum maritimum TaxID=107401 RepID=UPI001E32C511|nr:hypothetical protein [Tenacibaculum maritimum]MCD9563519.1 hypothetical protein [Tenacibaculum maritimum]MCD9579129.1 hypothetical protein [Tenacibaculum maritimum]MCD9596147.1 hypothetical protein [Tenacibaculum maritimum]MCD9613396.1 hypothetical protein [Tenacibaculum maritimum]